MKNNLPDPQNVQPVGLIPSTQEGASFLEKGVKALIGVERATVNHILEVCSVAVPPFVPYRGSVRRFLTKKRPNSRAGLKSVGTDAAAGAKTVVGDVAKSRPVRVAKKAVRAVKEALTTEIPLPNMPSAGEQLRGSAQFLKNTLLVNPFKKQSQSDPDSLGGGLTKPSEDKEKKD